ncbi:MAG: hypothetical protein NZZ41_05690 [Candidatus Dojkabacteria bacterium]|nr:hypothetical protein [Candidatus Dojkabacteria bacterium]
MESFNKTSNSDRLYNIFIIVLFALIVVTIVGILLLLISDSSNTVREFISDNSVSLSTRDNSSSQFASGASTSNLVKSDKSFLILSKNSIRRVGVNKIVQINKDFRSGLLNTEPNLIGKNILPLEILKTFAYDTVLYQELKESEYILEYNFPGGNVEEIKNSYLNLLRENNWNLTKNVYTFEYEIVAEKNGNQLSLKIVDLYDIEVNSVLLELLYKFNK